MILFKKREKNVNAETGKEEKMTETERKMAELGAAAYFDEKTVVVFEDLYHNGVKITSHADIKDKAQSITYPKKPETPVSVPKTGDTTNLLAYAGIALASLDTALAMAAKIRRKNAEDNNDDIE